MRSNGLKVTGEVEKADEAPLPLPPSAWRVTYDLQTAIERCLTEAGHQVLGTRFSDRDCRHWQLELLSASDGPHRGKRRALALAHVLRRLGTNS